MTLDEAIKHTEEVAKKQRKKAEDRPSTINWWGQAMPMTNEESEYCLKCAEEHEQLAEWLKDYKRLLAKENKQ